MDIPSYLPRLSIQYLYIINNCKQTTPKISPIFVKEINTENLQDVLSFKSQKTVAKFSKLLNKKNYKGFYAYYNDTVIAHVWVCINTTSHSIRHNRNIIINPNDGFVFNGAVSPIYQGCKIHQLMLSYVSCNITSIIDGELWVDTEKINIPANKAIEAVGGIFIKKVYLIKFRSRTILD